MSSFVSSSRERACTEPTECPRGHERSSTPRKMSPSRHGGGYVDHGADIFDDEDGEDYEEDYEEDVHRSSKKKKKERKDSGSMKDDAQVKLDNDEDLKEMLAGLNDEVLEMDFSPQMSTCSSNTSVRNCFKREASPKIAPRNIKFMKLSTPSQRANPIQQCHLTPSSTVMESVHSEVQMTRENRTADFDDYSASQMTESSPTALLYELETLSNSVLSTAEWVEGVTAIDEETIEVVAGAEEFYVKDNGIQMIRMYWLDAFEDPVKHSGTVYLFGRVNVRGDNWASCCIIVKNIYRQVFFLPRKTRLSVLKRHCGTASFKCRQAKKRFICDGTISGEELGEEINVLEVQYESSYPELSCDLSGETFSAVFNTTTTSLERLLVEKAIMGPGWIDITNYVDVTSRQSYCDYEFSVDMERMRNIHYNTSVAQSMPPVRMLVLNVLTTLNEKKENEICIISMLYNPSCNLNNPSINQKDLQRLCMITKPYGGTLPFDIKEQVTRRGWSDMVLTAGNEKALLSLFLAKIHKYDPDVLVGHDLSASISMLVSRMDKLKVANWSRTSRLRRSINVGKVAHNKSGQWK
ncbi:hypothetical protein KIN20_026997 [Parelaphostrongylus tenuis]|uniref:DNA-directed DNA polymerase family B exonuclease domain-containing protein n=1 Tax=Parelaphostrongylus tenuis TaxID=148309 RepID=A0AAD5QYT1_PARTN|nr:hypothetical protein KIN20_026997 [Parelaphostrongylus tenuis]